MPDSIKAMEIMNQLNMEGGKEPSAKARSTANDKNIETDKAAKFRQELEKAKADVRKIAEQVKSEPKYTGKAYSDTGPREGSRTAGGFGGADLEKGMMGGRMKKPSYCAGGSVKSASKRADGIAIRGKTRA